MDGDSGDSEVGAAGSAVAGLRAAVDAVLAVDLSAESRDELLALVRGLEVATRRLGFARLGVWAELEGRGAPSELLLRGLPDLVAVERGVTWRDAKAEAEAVLRFGPRRAVTGALLGPLFPACAAALADGSIHSGHARVVADAVSGLPDAARAVHGEQVEATLVEHAKAMDPRALGVLARRVTALLDPDGREPAHDWPHRSRCLDFAPPSPDGTVAVKGRLTPEAAAVWQTVVGSMTEALTDAVAGNPSEGPAVGQGPAGGGQGPAGGGSVGELGKDRRTPAQQRHDAFELAGRRLLSTGKLPDHAGLPATLIITMTLADLEQRAGVATTHTGGTLSIAQALRLAADAKHLPVVLAGDPKRPGGLGGLGGLGELGGEVLFEGKARRLATPAQRLALFARDRGCTFPGCAAPASDSEVHHAPDWLKGGRTDVDTMTISCGYHNREAIAQGWKTHVKEGVAWWTPPPWIDPGQKPRRNHLHHPELLIPEAEPPPEPEQADERADERADDQTDERADDAPKKPPPTETASEPEASSSEASTDQSSSRGRRAQRACPGCGQQLVTSVGSVRGLGDSDQGVRR